jgi:flagellar FliJ protein
MASNFSLQPLLELMQNRTDEATRHLGKLISAEQNARSRLEMLEQYRAEYADKLRDAIAQGLTRQVLANYQDFLGRIDEAIGQQREIVNQSEAGTRRGQEHWKQQNTRLKAIGTLATRHETRERQRENKQEQKLLDEFSARKYSSGQDDNQE